jgi:hypothetical protein
MIRATTTVQAVGITLLITLAIAPRAAIAQPPTTTTPQTGDQREPPVMRFDPQGIDLVQAVTVTLQNAPDIRLAEASATQALGAAQTQIGAFDTNFLGDTSYNYQRQMLSPNDFLGEVFKRQDLTAARDGEVANLARLNALRSQLTIMQNLAQECGTANVSAQLAALRRLDPETGAEMDILDALCASANQVDTSQQLRRDLLAIRQRLVTDTIDRVAQGVDESITAERRLAQIVGASASRRIRNFSATPPSTGRCRGCSATASASRRSSTAPAAAATSSASRSTRIARSANAAARANSRSTP